MSDFYKEVIAVVERKSTELSRFTYSTYMGHIRKLRIFRPKLDCQDIDQNFVSGYIEFMHSRGNSPGTIHRSLSILKMFLAELVKNCRIPFNPMQNMVLRRYRSHREFLEISELECLYQKFWRCSDVVTVSEREALRAFLFSCFTGLRYSDLKGLKTRDMLNGKIRLCTQKTNTLVYIPVPAPALRLVNGANDLALHVVNNSTFNKNLRSGAKKLGCHRHLHAHLARHTFATSCISFGIPLEVVSKLLGHANLQTTLIYARYSNSVIDREMQKFKINI